MPWSDLNAPGMEFGAELKLQNLGSSDNSTTEDWPDPVWWEWINLPFDTEDAGQHDLQSWSPVTSLDTLYDCPSRAQELPMHQPNHPRYHALPADSNAEIANHDIWSFTPLASDEPHSDRIIAPAMLSIRDAASEPLSPEPPFSTMLQRFPTLYSEPWTGEMGRQNRQPEPSIIHSSQTSCVSQQMSFQHFPTASQDNHLCHTQNGFEDHRPLPTDLTLPFMRQDYLQQAEPSQNSGRYEDVGDVDTIMHENHIVTNELPWEQGRLLPARASQPTFHTFSFNGRPVEQKTRRPRSKLRLEQIKKMRKLGSCLRCRRDKKPCSEDLICLRCARLGSAPNRQPCIRENFMTLSIFQPQSGGRVRDVIWRVDEYSQVSPYCQTSPEARSPSHLKEWRNLALMMKPKLDRTQALCKKQDMCHFATAFTMAEILTIGVLGCALNPMSAASKRNPLLIAYHLTHALWTFDTAFDRLFWEQCSKLENLLLMSLQGELLNQSRSSSSASRCNEVLAAVTILLSFQHLIRSLYPEKVSASQFCQHVKATLTFFLENRLARLQHIPHPATVTGLLGIISMTMRPLNQIPSPQYPLATFMKEYWTDIPRGTCYQIELDSC